MSIDQSTAAFRPLSAQLLRERGLTSASLMVDGANPNQAMSLYEDLGFEIASTETEWSIAVEDVP